jgi:putative ABC transport system substrate-binding protein
MLEHRTRIAEQAAKRHLPVMYPARQFVEVGGLAAYAANQSDVHRRAATYVDKILKGASPAELPVELPATFELLINLKTAQALGLIVPQSVLSQATELIQ